MEKHQIVIIVSVLLMISILATISLLTFTMKFEGRKIENANEFIVDYDYLNKTLTHYMTLKKGEVISVEAINIEGDLTLSLDDMRGQNIYKNREVKRERLAVEIPHSGKYVISVVGSSANGSVSFNRIRE